MNIQTKYHGEITIEETDIIQFENGIPGFWMNRNLLFYH